MTIQDPTPKGARLQKLLNERWTGTDIEFVRALGETENFSQKATNYKKRGIPSRLAPLAAQILNCTPTEISATKPTAPAASTTLSPQQSMLLAAVEGFDDRKMALLIQAAGHIASGSRLVPATDTPDQKAGKIQEGRAVKGKPAHREKTI